jgi:hypothetical protein
MGGAIVAARGLAPPRSGGGGRAPGREVMVLQEPSRRDPRKQRGQVRQQLLLRWAEKFGTSLVPSEMPPTPEWSCGWVRSRAHSISYRCGRLPRRSLVVEIPPIPKMKGTPR